MKKCEDCGKELGFLNIKHEYLDDDNLIYLCHDCNYKFEQKEIEKKEKDKKIQEIKKQKEIKIKLQKALERNNQWEYKTIHLKTLEQEFHLKERLTDELLNKYGQEGWELVNIIAPTTNHKLANNLMICPIAIVFKRKI